jgi:hypothetical protein
MINKSGSRTLKTGGEDKNRTLVSFVAFSKLLSIKASMRDQREHNNLVLNKLLTRKIGVPKAPLAGLRILQLRRNGIRIWVRTTLRLLLHNSGPVL